MKNILYTPDQGYQPEFNFFCIKCDEFTTYPTVLCLVNAKYNIYPWPGLPTRVQIIFCKKCDEFTTYPTLLCLVNAKYNIYPWPGLPTRVQIIFCKKCPLSKQCKIYTPETRVANRSYKFIVFFNIPIVWTRLLGNTVIFHVHFQRWSHS